MPRSKPDQASGCSGALALVRAGIQQERTVPLARGHGKEISNLILHFCRMVHRALDLLANEVAELFSKAGNSCPNSTLRHLQLVGNPLIISAGSFASQKRVNCFEQLG